MCANVRSGLLCTCIWLALSGPCSEASDALDQATTALTSAKVKYNRETESFDKSVKAAIEKKIESARRAGNKSLIDQLKAESELFDADDTVPPALPTSYLKKQTAIRGEMEQAYTAAIKAFTKQRADKQAAQAEKELATFQFRSSLAATKKMLVGTWKLKAPSGYTSDLIFHANGTVDHSAAGMTLQWSVDTEAGHIKIAFPGGKFDKIKLPLKEKESPGFNINGMEYSVTKIE